MSGILPVRILSPGEKNVAGGVMPVSIVSTGEFTTNAAYFGAKADGATDNTSYIQRAINACSDAGGGVVTLGAGTYLVDKLTLPTNVSLEGVGCRATYIKARTSSETELIAISTGPIQGSGLRKLRLDGGAPSAVTNAGQWAIQITSIADGSSTGGMWYTAIDEVYIRGFDSGIKVSGGSTGSSLPMQFLRFKNVWIDIENPGGTCLTMLGQTGQIYWDHCVFQRRDSSNRSGALVSLGSSSETNRPQDVTFFKCTFQNSEKGIETYNVLGLHVIACWFENLYRSINITATTTGALVQGSKFANAGSDGASGGYVLQAGSSCKGAFLDNVCQGTYDYAVIGTNASGIRVAGNHFPTSPIVGYTSGLTKQISVSGSGTGASGTGTLTLENWNTVAVNSSAVEIQTINTNLQPGEVLTLYATGGSIVLNTAASSTNLNLSGQAAPLTVASGKSVSFGITDLSARRVRLLSVSS